MNKLHNKLLSFIMASLALILITSFHLMAQDDDEEVIVDEQAAAEKQLTNLSGLLQMMRDNKGEELILSDLDIRPDDSDSKLAEDKIFFSFYVLDANEKSSGRVYFYNCDFSTNESSPIVFRGWSFIKLNFAGCNSSAPIIFENCSQKEDYPFYFDNSSFSSDLSFKNEEKGLNKLQFINCKFHKSLRLESEVNSLDIKGCRFEADSNLYTMEDRESTLYQLYLDNNTYGEIYIGNSEFSHDGVAFLYSISFANSDISALNILNTKLIYWYTKFRFP